MSQPMTYPELNKNDYDNDKMYHPEQDMKSLKKSRTGSQRHILVYYSLIECMNFLFKQPKFIDAALIIYNTCKSIIDAQAGYVALRDEGGKLLDVLHLDTGGLTCNAQQSSQLPIKGLSREALQKGTSLCSNDFNKSKWKKLLPKGHIRLNNVLFAPIVIDQKSVGLLGFANKPGNFNQEDIHIATSFAKLTALALSNSKAWQFMKRKPAQ